MTRFPTANARTPFYPPKSRAYPALLAVTLATRWPAAAPGSPGFNEMHGHRLAAWIEAARRASLRHKAALERQCSVPMTEAAQEEIHRARREDEAAAGARLAEALGISPDRIIVGFGLGGGRLQIKEAAGDPARHLDVPLPL
jgi:hypothetical protein